MLALPLLIALAVTADPPAAPAAPAAPQAAAEEAEVPTFQVAPPDAPGFETPPPPVAFTLDGFLAPEKTVAGAVARLGGSSRGLDGGLDVTLRRRGFVGGATIGGAFRSATAASGEAKSLRLLGLVAGYGYARGLYRGEALLGWGVATDAYDTGSGGTLTRSGHFRSAQVGLDRAVCGGEGWRASLGLGLWYRDTFGLAASPTSHAEVGGGLRLGLEAGW